MIKAGNQIGTSMLTDPMKFSTAEKYITSAASLGGKPYYFVTINIVEKKQKKNGIIMNIL